MTVSPLPPALPTTSTPLNRFDGGAPKRRATIVFHRIDRLPLRPPRQETIAGLAAAGEIVALAGAPGSGKSALAALAARALADGSPFLGRPVTRGATVYVAAERAAEVERRLRAAASPGAAVYVSDARPQLADPISVDELIEAIQAVTADEPLPIRLIVLDTAARCFRGLDENSSRDMGLAAEGMAQIVEAVPSAVLLILHHLDKAASAMRGSTALLGAVDVELTVRGHGPDRRLAVTKANAVVEGQQFAFRMVARRAADGFDVIEAEVVEGGSAGSRCNDVNDQPLPPDAGSALAALVELSGEGAVSLDAWRDATKRRFGGRSPQAMRQAWSKARHRLIDLGYVTTNGNTVSVSDASAHRQQRISADGGKASARSVSAPPSIRGGADVADAPRIRAQKEKGRRRQR